MRHFATDIGLKQRQVRVAAQLASGSTIAAASHSTSISRSTIHRWMHTPSFRQAIDSAIANRKQAERELIERMAERAADSLSRELSRKRSPAGKMALIRGVLDLALQMEQGHRASL
jgi:hypothetical protein